MFNRIDECGIYENRHKEKREERPVYYLYVLYFSTPFVKTGVLVGLNEFSTWILALKWSFKETNQLIS